MSFTTKMVAEIASRGILPILRSQPGMVDVSSSTLRKSLLASGSEVPRDWTNQYRKLDAFFQRLLPVATDEGQAIGLLQKAEAVYFRKGRARLIMANTLQLAEAPLAIVPSEPSLAETIFATGGVRGGSEEMSTNLARGDIARTMAAEQRRSTSPEAKRIEKMLKSATVEVTQSRRINNSSIARLNFNNNFIVSVPDFGDAADAALQQFTPKRLDTILDLVATEAFGDTAEIFEFYKKRFLNFYGTKRREPLPGKVSEQSRVKGFKDTQKSNIRGKGAKSRQGAVIRGRQGTFLSLTNLIKEANSGALTNFVREKMGKGMASRVLNYRTGRFASSAEILDATIRQGKNGPFIASLDVNYMKRPYSTFERSGAQGRVNTLRETPTDTIKRAALEFFKRRIPALQRASPRVFR